MGVFPYKAAHMTLQTHRQNPRERLGRRLRRIFSVLALAVFLPLNLRCQSSASHGAVQLTLDEFLKRIIERNESVQVKLLELEVNRRKARAEYGAFEPEFFAGTSREINSRENTVEQQRATLSTTGNFDERNNLYQGGIETLAPTGTRIRIGYTLRDLKNNLQDQSNFLFRGATNGEFQTFFGINLTQPLLKNAGLTANLAGLRLAALGSDIAYQDYRRQLMLVLGAAEAAYWNLYMAQEQVRFFIESVATAERVLQDNRTRVQSGRAAELEILEAEAALALRRSKLSEAEQKLYEAANRIISFYSETVLATNRLVRAVDQPDISGRPPPFFEAWRAAYEWNPDYLSQRQKLMQESVRLGYSRNQRLPELNLKGSYGLNGLGETPADSWDDIERRGFPSWSVGIEFRVPLTGGIKSDNEWAAARIRHRQAQVSLREIETQVVNGLDTVMHKIQSAHDTVTNYQTVVHFNQNLLNAALARLELGRIESRKVLDIEADLFESKNSRLEAMVQYQRARLELELLQGTLLKNRRFELGKWELEKRTATLLRNGGFDDARYEQFVQAVRQDYERHAAPPPPFGTPEQQRARDAMLRKIGEWSVTNAPPAPARPSDSNQSNQLPQTSPPQAAPQPPVATGPSLPGNTTTNQTDRLLEALRRRIRELSR